MIHLRSITRQFGETVVLRDIDLQIHEGNFTSLLGPSGCGKSTLLRILAGLDQPTSGEVLFDGHNVAGLTASERNIAMVFQSYALYPHMTVRQNITLPLAMRNLSRVERLPVVGHFLPSTRAKRAMNAAEVDRIAEILEIEELLKRRPSELSGGQKQRVAVGRALVRDPVAFLLDEPLSNLDTKLRGQMRGEISELHRRTGKTFVYVTHDQTEAMSMSDQIAVIMDGEILQVASPEELYARPASVRVAEFIGEHPINLVPLVHSETRLPAPFNSYALRESAAAPITLGLRPESLYLKPGGELSGMVIRREYLGGRSIVDVRLDGEVTLRASLEEGAPLPEVGHALQLGIDPDRIHAFDTSTGTRIAATVTLLESDLAPLRNVQ